MTQDQNYEYTPDAPVLTLANAIQSITEKLNALIPNVGDEDQKALRKIISVWNHAVLEIENGGLTMETCQRGSALCYAAENNAEERVLAGGTKQDLNMFQGLVRQHDIMGLITKQQNMNEGDKDCCPYCGGCG